RAKPAPDVLLKAADLLGAEGARTLYIGDTPIDAQAANAAGMKCVCVTTSNARETLEAAGAWRVIPDLTFLVPLLRGEKLL
ncbi:MAG: HAD family phosphatase, partial [Pyramidobacter sp.]|nr:HAD family phosphatase [Pyramidobacter sp.]